jgi:HAD superfamily hydrolase (TIGR01509 family)
MIEAVFIDLDDTLCMTEEICFNLENETLAKLGRPPMTRGTHQSNWGMPLAEAIVERSPGVNVDEFYQFFPTVLQRYTDEGLLDQIPDENYEALDQMIKMGKSLIVLTNRNHEELKHLLEPAHEPDPRVFAHIEEAHGWKPNECVYVGDSPSDAAAAKGAGLHFVASLESGLRTERDFEDYPVDVFIPSFTKLPEAVEQLDL